jgi:hypothetical protein
MTDLHLIALLKQHGWKLHTRSTLRNWTKERLIDEIECLENNWGVSLEREEISFEYKKKLIAENERLEQQIEQMKNCLNCKFGDLGEDDIWCYNKERHGFYDAKKGCEHWEVKE